MYRAGEAGTGKSCLLHQFVHNSCAYSVAVHCHGSQLSQSFIRQRTFTTYYWSGIFEQDCEVGGETNKAAGMSDTVDSICVCVAYVDPSFGIPLDRKDSGELQLTISRPISLNVFLLPGLSLEVTIVERRGLSWFMISQGRESFYLSSHERH